MPFVRRDEAGKIIAVLASAGQEGAEEVDAREPELAAFLYETLLELAIQQEWLKSDLSLSRVLEDLVDVLIEKGALMFTDLPVPAQEKLRARRGLRREFALIDSLFGEDDLEGEGFL